jgi:hypothetical protein
MRTCPSVVHGSPTEISNDRAVPVPGGAPGDPQAAYISVGAIRNVLNNRANFFGTMRRHPYRFVFYNACETADGKDWHEAFGILKEITSADLAIDPNCAQAFVGWHGRPKAPETNSDLDDLMETYAVFFGAWMNEVPLDQCLFVASQKEPFGPGGGITLDFPFGKKYSWIERWNPCNDVNKNFNLVVYGYPRLTRSSYAQ